MHRKKHIKLLKGSQMVIILSYLPFLQLSGINGANTRGQRLGNIIDSAELHANDTLKSGRGLCDFQLVHKLAQSSSAAVAFLEGFGLDLSVVSHCGGHTVPRTHREPNTIEGKPKPVGFDIIQALKEHLKSVDPSRLGLLTKSHVTELITNDGAVTGVKYTAQDSGETKIVNADAVILTTGGYSSDPHGLLQRFTPSLTMLPTTNGPFATGDGVHMGVSVGALLRDMDKVSCM